MEKYKDKKYSEEYHLLKHHNNVLFKEDLDEEYHYSKYFHCEMNEVDYLNRILKIDPQLTKTYQEIKRYYYFNHYWNEYTPSEALDYINSFIKEWFVSDNKHLIKLATTLDNWKQYIANSFIPYERNNGETVRLSNGKIEGKNSYDADHEKSAAIIRKYYEGFDVKYDPTVKIPSVWLEKLKKRRLLGNSKFTYSFDLF